MGHFGIAKTLDILHEHFYWIIENENWWGYLNKGD
jgi:hypothetical protein